MYSGSYNYKFHCFARNWIFKSTSLLCDPETITLDLNTECRDSILIVENSDRFSLFVFPISNRLLSLWVLWTPNLGVIQQVRNCLGRLSLSVSPDVWPWRSGEQWNEIPSPQVVCVWENIYPFPYRVACQPTWRIDIVEVAAAYKAAIIALCRRQLLGL